jgi:two-component system sensor histidine kinase and response regulator WspE
MSAPGEKDLSGFSMLDLFRQETEAQTAILNEGLLALEQNPQDRDRLAALMRAAHSVKGAARIVGLDAAVQVAHALEDCFVAAQRAQFLIDPPAADVLLRGVDLLAQIARLPESESATWPAQHQTDLADLTSQLAAIRARTLPSPPSPPSESPATPPPPQPDAQSAKSVPGPATAAMPAQPAPAPAPASEGPSPERGQTAVRVSADQLNRMLGMMGELMVQTRWFDPFAAQLLELKRKQDDLARLVGRLRDRSPDAAPDSAQAQTLAEVQRALDECRQRIVARLEEFDFFACQASDLTERLYREGIASRLRPFAEGTHGFARMVRDLARQLNKQARLEIQGQQTGVDREILDRLEAPLTHLLRNGLDHGLETPAERQAAGKPAEGLLTLTARHHSGQLHVTVADDGRGIDLERLRAQVTARELISAELAARLSEPELLEFLFLPGFSTANAVTELSGRGVGLDVVRSFTQSVGGLVRVENRPGAGLLFHLQLPITLSVVRALLVEVGGEPLAIPLARIHQLASTNRDAIRTLEGRWYLTVDQANIGLVDARELLELPSPRPRPAQWPVVILGDRIRGYGLVVDRLLGESKLVVRHLDAQLGKVRDVASVSLLNDGSPVLILDPEDLIRSIENQLAGGRLKHFQSTPTAAPVKKPKRILVAEDSLTVRELERKLLVQRGYLVDVAVDGMEAWNDARLGHYDLIISDVDMPRLNGIDLVRNLKRDPRLSPTPIIIVSYKDRDEDRLRGLEAGANHYLAKSSFHDDSFLTTVTDLIGEP